MNSNSESSFIRHSPCPDCGSKDNLGVYTDHTHCFGCKETKYFNSPQDTKQIPKVRTDMIDGTIQALPKRKINSDTCKVFTYETGFYKDKPVHIANYFDKSYKKVAQHLRFVDKSFIWLGDVNSITLFGQQSWRDGGRMVIITEGEIDAMSVSQLQNNKYPVVSVPSGATSAKKYIKKELEWLSKFDSIVLMFDNDEAGVQASLDCASVLPVKKVKIAKLQGKDANELLVDNKGDKVIDAIWGAKPYTPQGIILGQDTKELLLNDETVESIPYVWNGLNRKLSGIRFGELTLITAGSGTGKSQVCREIAYDIINRGFKVGYIALEESVKRSIRGIVSIPLNAPIHIPEVKKTIPEELIVNAWENIKDKICFYDHFGSSDSEDLIGRIRYMVQGLDCKVIFLDHISIVISGLEEGDERRLIDNTMTKLRSLVEELKCAMFVVSHLKRPEGKGHEEGQVTSLNQLRGSHSLAQLSDGVIGFERNQQSESDSNVMQVRVLKNRFSGDTGIATTLIYDKQTGRLAEGTFDE